MICNHCGRTLENEAQLFCAFCGYPVGDVKKGFFAKTQETNASAANEPTAQQPAITQPAQPVPKPVMPQAAQMSMPIGMMGMMPQMSMMQSMTGVQGVQGVMPYMGMMPNMMPNVVSQMSTMQNQQSDDSASAEQTETPQTNPQQMFQNPMMMGVAGVPQMMGYDTNGNPIYIQMMPQVMGYDPYGNPIYAMIPVPCAVPQMQTPPPQQEKPVEPAKEEKKPSSVSVSGFAISQPLRRKTEESVSQKPKEQPAPEVSKTPEETPASLEEKKPEENSASEKPQVANAQRVGHPIQEGFFARQVKLQNPVANGVAIKPSEKPSTEAQEETTEPEDTEPTTEIPVSADVLMLSEEPEAPKEEGLPDEQELLDSIFSDRPKKYTMSEGVQPSSQTFSISLSANEVTSVRRSNGVVSDSPPKAPKPKKQEKSREEWIFSEEQQELPPPKALFDKPPQKSPSQYGRSGFSMSRQVQPPQSYPPQGGNSQQFQPQPYPPQQGNSQQFQPQPYPPQQGNSWQYQQSQPYPPQQGNSWQYQQSQPYPPQGNNYQYQQQQQPQPYQPPQGQGHSRSYPQPTVQYQQVQPYPQQATPPPEQQSQYFQRQDPTRQPELSQTETKIKPTKVSRPMPKEEKPEKPKSEGKKPLKIIDAADFFGDEPKVKSRGELGVTAIDDMTDEQLAAQLARMESSGKKKKSRRSMKAATDLEADFSNIPTDMLPTDN